MDNYMKLEFPSKSFNEAFARSAVGAFASRLDMTIEDLADIKTAVSEAVTNAIVHAYRERCGIIEIRCSISENTLTVTIKDTGCGIEDIDAALQPMFSGTDDEERSGMGFTVMESFMDTLKVYSIPNEGTTVTMTKHITGASDV